MRDDDGGIVGSVGGPGRGQGRGGREETMSGLIRTMTGARSAIGRGWESEGEGLILGGGRQ